MTTDLVCSFCRKSEHQVAKLVAGPSGVTICDECVAIAVRIMSESEPPGDRSRPQPDRG